MKWIDPSFFRPFFPWIIWKGDANKRQVYLTFDDGPHPEYTRTVIEILNREKAPATFFLNGSKILQHPGVLHSIVKNGHSIGNHGFSHQKLSGKKADFILDELKQTNGLIQKVTGVTPRFFRPPHGRFDLRFRKFMDQTGLRMVIWSLITWDFADPSPQSITARVMRHLHPGAILVFHDGLQNTPVMLEALPGILKEIHKRGYTVARLEDLV